MRNGVKLCATTHRHEFNVVCDPVNAMDYYAITGWMKESLTDPEWQLENLFMETQGNWSKFRMMRERSMRMYY